MCCYKFLYSSTHDFFLPHSILDAGNIAVNKAIFLFFILYFSGERQMSKCISTAKDNRNLN